MSGRSPDVVVIGGGLVGLACARELALAGRRVTLLERGTCGTEASAAAAGLLQPYAETPEPGAYLDACREALDLWPDWLDAVRAESGQEVELSDWGTLFVDLEPETADAPTDTTSTRAEAAGAALHAESLRGPRPSARSAGRIPDSRQWVERMQVALTALDVAFERLDGEEVYRRLPQLAPGARDGLHLPQERRVHNQQACRAAAEACRRAGVELLEHAPVTGVELKSDGAHIESPAWSGEAGQVVLAAGAWSGGIPGLPAFPVRPRRGQMLHYHGCPWPWTGCLRAGRRYTVRRGADELLVGSTVEDVGFDKSTTTQVLDDLREFAETLLPPLRDLAPADGWAGLRPGTADDLPLLGSWRDTPLWLATGHFRSGILLAPWSARRLREWMTGTAETSNAFSPNRLAPPAPGDLRQFQ